MAKKKKTARQSPQKNATPAANESFVPGTIADLAGDDMNPRAISHKNAAGLNRSLQKFGDLSGIVFNINTRQLVAGHQRVDQLFKTYGPLPIEQLTESRGVIKTPDGEEFPVRFVDWDLDKQRAANVAANSPTLQGEFTDELQVILLDMQESDTVDFETMGFDALLEVGDDENTSVKRFDVQAPPPMTWVLVGIETDNYGKIAESVQTIGALEEIITCEVVSNNGN